MRKTLFSIASFAFLGALASAQTIVVPAGDEFSDANANNRIPFGPASGEVFSRYQQAYSAASMAPLMGTDITSIAFRNEGTFGDEPSHSYTGMLIEISTTTNVLVDQLTTAFDSNHGANRTVVYSGNYTSPLLIGTQSPNPFDFKIDFQNAFTYTGGDLLVDFSYASTTAQEFYLDAPFTPGDPVSRAAMTNVFGDFADTLGYVTQFEASGTPSLGTNYCGPAVMNSSGNSGEISASGSASVGNNNLTLEASGMPMNQFGYFLNSTTQAFVFPVPNSQGALCLGGQVGRYNANVFNTGATGTGSLLLDLPNTPTPSGNVAIMAGQTWNFTCWFRDNNPTPTSNFTDGLSVDFVN